MSAVQFMVGIAGASGAGKSRLANELLQRLRQAHSKSDVSILNEDSYYRRRDDVALDQRQSINYDHPDAFEHELLAAHLRELRLGKTVEVPVYDYTIHNRSEQSLQLAPAKVLILEGILIMHCPELRELLDLMIYVDVPLDICLTRRMERDIVARGRTLESVLQQYRETVRPMFFKFIHPSKEHADLIVPGGGENEMAISVLQGHLDRMI